ANAGYEVRVNRVADLALGRVDIETTTEQWKYLEGRKIKVGESVVTRPVDPAVQFQALKKLSKDTGEDAIVGVQNKLLGEELLDMGRDLLKEHQRGLMAPQSVVDAEIDIDVATEPVEQSIDSNAATESNNSTNISTPYTPTADTEPQDVSISIQGKELRDGGKGGRGGPVPSIPSPLSTYRQKNSYPLIEAP
ncbi:hypothetical protein LCGC14_2796200, partial [marine sediment metagenome]